MGTLLFATTKLNGLHASGRTADLQRDLLAAVLERHLGTPYANLFAEFETRDSDTRDWFVDEAPAPINIRDLPPEHAAALQARCEQQLAKIRTLADRLDTANSRDLARALRDATVFPRDDLWFYKGAPLIVNWGFARADAPAAEVAAIAGATVLLDPVVPPPLPPSATPPESKRKKRWFPWLPILLWFTFAGLVGKIYAEFLPACALQLPGSLTHVIGNCSGAPSATLAAEGMALQRAVERAELDYARSRLTCADQRQGANDTSTIPNAAESLRPLRGLASTGRNDAKGSL